MEPNAETGRGWCERTSADLSSLLVEWSRALRATGFFDADASEAGPRGPRKDVVDRAFLAWQIELERAGPLEIWIEQEGFRGTGIEGRVHAAHLDDLAQAFRASGVSRIGITPEVERDAFQALFANLAERDDAALSLIEALRNEPHTGFEINGARIPPPQGAATTTAATAPHTLHAPAAEPIQPAAASASPVRTISAAMPRIAPVEAPTEPTTIATRQTPSSATTPTPLSPSMPSAPPAVQAAPLPADEAESASASEPGVPTEAGADTASETDLSTRSEAPIEGASLGSSLLGPSRNADATPLPTRETPIVLADLPPSRREGSATPAPLAATPPLPTGPPGEEGSSQPGLTSLLGPPSDADDKPSLDDEPLLGPPDPIAQHLFDQLCELDSCTDDDYYYALAGEVVETAARLGDDGYDDEAYRAMLVLCDHSTGGGGRSGVQLRRSLEALNELSQGSRLDALISRACGAPSSAGIRAAQVMLQLDGRLVPKLLDQLADDPKPDRAAQLAALVIATGEAAAPALERAMRGDPGARARRAIQLAGELQSPRLTQALTEVLRTGPAPLAKEAARALAQIAGPEVGEALLEALQSTTEGVPATAALCLGQCGETAALRPMMARLDDALEQRDHVLARELIRALGQLGEEGAVPKLVAVLERKSWLQRKAQRDLKLAAVAALERMPGREALRALHRAAGHGDSRVRERVAQILSRRPRQTPAAAAVPAELPADLTAETETGSAEAIDADGSEHPAVAG